MGALCQAVDPNAGVRCVASDSKFRRSVVRRSLAAIDPAWARQGLGRRLLETATAAAASEGRRYMTLLVSEDNAEAQALYTNAGFERRSQFLFGWRERPIPRTAAA